MSNVKKPTMQFKVEPFKHPLTTDPNYSDKTWKIIEDAMHQIFNQNASGLSFEELYRNAYNLVLHKFGDKLYNGLVATLTGQLKATAAKIEAVQGTPFLKELIRQWESHEKSAQMIRDILMYMDRIYVTQQQKTPVHQLALDLWRDHVMRNKAIASRLLALALDMVYKERTGDVVDRALLRSITKMLVSLGHAVYVEDFESHFLAATAEFYRKEAAELIVSSDCPQYMRLAERRLGEEVERCGHYLDASSEARVTRVVEAELIVGQMRPLVDMEQSGLLPLLQDDKCDDLARMYSLLRRAEGGLALLRTMMAEHAKEAGKALVGDPERCKEPVDFVVKLLDLRDKYERIIATAFGQDKMFRNALNQAFEHFINLNARSPEFISLFIDDMLKKGLKGMGEAEAEVVWDKVMALFRYLQEKDVFEKYYKQHLGKRLLSGRTVSDDAERNLLVKLKTECGYQFTSKLESMFTDIKTSRDTMQDFRESRAQAAAAGLDPQRAGGSGSGAAEAAPPPELNVQVLTTGSWPMQPGATCSLPREMWACTTAFGDYYLAKHSGRKLSWPTNLGSGDLRADFGNGRRYELNMSTHQMVILLLFNDADRLGYKDIAAATDIPPAELKRSLQGLACVKGKAVLRKEPASKDIAEEDEFVFNDKFTSKLHKVKISNVSASKESESEKAETRHKVEEDRKPQIEAAIVRIMKARKVLDHNSIVTEVTRQLSPRFLPNPVVIKKRIESLIEREFLERDAEDRKLYRYLA